VGTQWDLVVDLRCSATAWLLRARERRILKQAPEPVPKVVEAASVLGLEATPPAPAMWLTEADRAEARDRLPDLPDGENYLAICPSASWIYKVWPPEKFAEFILRFTAPDGIMPRAHVVMLGGPHDGGYAQPIYNALPEMDFIDLLGLGLRETAACLERARLYVGNDSGLMHMSAAAGTPTLGLFGPSDDRCYAPWGPHCDHVRGPASFDDIDRSHADRRKHPESLLADLDVDTVYEAAHRLYERTKP
jgi:ADP-heptose:LPS heptosyltransferase